MTLLRAAFLPVLLALSSPAQAITFATGAGADNAGCGAVTSPCRTLQQAVTNTPSGGYVVLQGPADFGHATIEKSLTVVGEGGATLNGAGASLTAGVVSVHTGANDAVWLRGLTIINAPSMGAGVVWGGYGKRLEIADCVIRQTQGFGVMAQLLDGAGLSIIDTDIEATIGVFTGSQSGSFRTYLEGLRISASENGLRMGHGWSLTPLSVIVNSSIANAAIGMKTLSGGLTARKLEIRNGGSALAIDSGETLLSRVTIIGNSRVVDAQTGSGALFTYGDNVIRGNANDTLNRFSLQTYH